MTKLRPPEKQGLYDPQFEHDACGVGFVCHMKGKRSHETVDQAITILINLDHRGGCGCEPNTGDGAGILLQVPHKFLKRVTAEQGLTLPEPGEYAVGMCFTSPDAAARAKGAEIMAQICVREGVELLGWRDVPTDNSSLGATAKASEPFVRQVFLKRPASCADDLAFDRKLYILRKLANAEIRVAGVDEFWYCPSLSSRTIIYKGMLMPEQVNKYYPELRDPDVDSALALVHSRFSTNTFPSWELHSTARIHIIL